MGGGGGARKGKERKTADLVRIGKKKKNGGRGGNQGGKRVGLEKKRLPKGKKLWFRWNGGEKGTRRPRKQEKAAGEETKGLVKSGGGKIKKLKGKERGGGGKTLTVPGMWDKKTSEAQGRKNQGV